MVTDRLFAVLPRTADQDADGRLTVGGCAHTAREYLDAFKSRHADTDVHFASKALPCAPVTRILAEEGLGCDVASAGELATPQVGDHVVMPVTGARRPPVILCRDGDARLAVRRERMSDLLARDLL